MLIAQEILSEAFSWSMIHHSALSCKP